MLMRRSGLLLASICLFASIPAVAQTSALGKELTPYGAELKGNEAGTIPPWTGGLTPDQMPALQDKLENPFEKEKPLFTITPPIWLSTGISYPRGSVRCWSVTPIPMPCRSIPAIVPPPHHSGFMTTLPAIMAVPVW